MAKRKAAESKRKQRPRGEIDRNYFFGDVFRKTGAALWVALFLISAYTPFSWGQAQHNGASFGTVVAIFAVIGVALYWYGGHLRREATHWEAD
jgi:membrane protein DedA with SNARE-associated domain